MNTLPHLDGGASDAPNGSYCCLVVSLCGAVEVDQPSIVYGEAGIRVCLQALDDATLGPDDTPQVVLAYLQHPKGVPRPFHLRSDTIGTLSITACITRNAACFSWYSRNSATDCLLCLGMASQQSRARMCQYPLHSSLHSCQLRRKALRRFGHCSADNLQRHTPCKGWIAC